MSKLKTPPYISRNLCGDIEYQKQVQTKLCERLDELISGTALLAVIDGTIVDELHPWMLHDEDLHLIAHSGFVDLGTIATGDMKLVLAELVRSLYGLVQYFCFCEAEISETWATDMHQLDIADCLHDLPQTGDGAHVAYLAQEMGMNEKEIFALIDYLYPGGYGVKQ